MTPGYRAAIVTVSDSVAQGTRQDLSGPAVARLLEAEGWTVRSTEVLPDDFNLLRERLGALASDTDVDVVITTGGTGLGPRDRTPEATTSVMERSVPGLAELMRREGTKKTPLAALSRGVVGMKAKTLIVNLPGMPEGAEDSLRAILPLLPHAVAVVRGEAVHAAAPARAEEAPPPPAEAAEVAAGVAPQAAEPAGEPVSETPSEEQPLAPEEGLGKAESL